MEETLRLEDLVQILKKKVAWIVLTTVAGIGLAAGVTFFLDHTQIRFNGTADCTKSGSGRL